MSRYIEFPEWWDELTPKQFHYFMKRFSGKALSGEWGIDDLKLDFADYLLGRKKYFRQSKREAYHALVFQLAGSLSWMYDESKNPVELNFDTTINLFPSLGKLVGPASHGSDLRFGEYRKCVALYEEFNQSEGDEMFLDMLSGSLYRHPGKTPEQRREPFSEFKIEEYGRNGSRFDYATKYAVYVWFMNFNRHLVSGEFVIDGKTITFAPIFGKPGGEKSSGQDIGFSSILFTMADAGTFGKADEVDQTPLFQIMLKLLHDKMQVDTLKSKTK
jgi:hypothetical protein